MAAKDLALGRGLDALLGDISLQTQGEGSIMLPISQVEAGIKQPRKRFEPEALADLSQSIAIHGIIQPLTVRRLGSGYYQIIAGERRWRAAKMAGLMEVPATIIEADDRKVMELGLIENLQREDLNPIEEAAGFQVLMEEHNLTQEEVGNRVGKSRSGIANALRLLALPDPIRQLLEEDKISAGHGRAILSIPSGSLQRKLAQMILEEGLSVRQAEAIAKKMSKPQKEEEEHPSPKEDPIALYREAAAKELSNRWGRKVSISMGAKKGKLEVEFYNDEDLTALLDLIEGRTSEYEEGSP